jgi:D-sedoheptulose 7-phosphate isomerase
MEKELVQKRIEEYLAKLGTSLKNMKVYEIEKAAEILLEARNRKANVFVCGNGGSALTASHLACDLNKGASYRREARFRVIPLTDNIGTIMAYANDVDYQCIFVEQLKNHFNRGDVVIGFSGSGNSENVIRAIEYANDNEGITIGITGYNGGRLKKVAKNSINANIEDMQISEDIHMVICHILMKLLSEPCIQPPTPLSSPNIPPSQPCDKPT